MASPQQVEKLPEEALTEGSFGCTPPLDWKLLEAIARKIKQKAVHYQDSNLQELADQVKAFAVTGEVMDRQSGTDSLQEYDLADGYNNMVPIYDVPKKQRTDRILTTSNYLKLGAGVPAQELEELWEGGEGWDNQAELEAFITDIQNGLHLYAGSERGMVEELLKPMRDRLQSLQYEGTGYRG